MTRVARAVDGVMILEICPQSMKYDSDLIIPCPLSVFPPCLSLLYVQATGTKMNQGPIDI